jgi:flagellar motor switch protein FliN/FliY
MLSDAKNPAGSATKEPQGGVATASPETDRVVGAVEASGESIASIEEDLGSAVPDAANLGVLLDIEMKLTVELGRTTMKVREVMNLCPGSVVELGKPPSDPVDIMVNGVLLARGEVVVIDEHFAVRITKLISRSERIKKLV